MPTVDKSDEKSVAQLVLPRVAAGRTIQAACVHSIPSVEVKLLYMSVGRVRVWAVSVVQVICMPK